jgi:hypothetical protein
MPGTISNAAWTHQGQFGSALLFNGASSFVDIGNAPSLQIHRQPDNQRLELRSQVAVLPDRHRLQAHGRRVRLSSRYQLGRRA